ncbi:bifunctional TH2 protein, mitochondrial-like [Carica papaya]|uniref:bifunctional TH2 protein, mitochondrial-like n=1 Tax=Carica papaya TaxID=3649 RepID=UPI000B8CA011|nr:bifunctional TH2 protein, mitochondrial-like [Carica papaya]
MGTVRGVEEGGIARKLWIKFKSHSVFAKYTPFFVCLASGHLNSDTFLHFISQDIPFLDAFFRAYELAEECADDEDDKSAIRELRKRVEDRLKKQDTFVRQWGFEPLKECPFSNLRVKFTDFLMATAAGKVEGEKVPGKIATPFEKTKVAAYTLGAISPCMRLFSFISKEIQAILDPSEGSHVYKKWIDTYCSEEFEEAASQTEDLVDRLSISLTGEELEVIEKLYHQALKLEVDFFSAQPVVQKTIVPLSSVQVPIEDRLTIFCDFDLACTTVDSSAFLAEIAIVTATKIDAADGSETRLSRMSSAELRSTWGVISNQYTDEYESCIESVVSGETVAEFNYESLHKALEQLADFEKNANLRVVQSGVLKGLCMEDIRRAGQSLVLQDGCRGFFEKIVKSENFVTDVHVLSYCWCGDLIRSAFSSGDLNVLKVHSNELAYQESISTGEIVKKVESPMEKLQAFNNIVKDSHSRDKCLTIYIGGSVGDLLCLLEADIGIVIGSSSSLRRLGGCFGISFVPLFSGLVEKQREICEGRFSGWKGRSGILYTVSSWAEIHAFLLGS